MCTLPSCRHSKGLDTHARALAAGVKTHGCTVHFVVPELDAGPAILQAEVPVLPGDDEQSLAARVLAEEHRIYPEALRLVAEGRVDVCGHLISINLRRRKACRANRNDR
jgi:phosphoribosylglycinamide formyltransferase 1